MARKILIITNNLAIGGAERLVVDDINEMLRIGIDVTLITLAPESHKSFSSDLLLDQCSFHCNPFKNFLDISSWISLVRSIKESKTDLIITQLWYANTIGRIAGILAGAPAIVSFEQNVYDGIKSKKRFIADWFLQFFTTKIIAVSEAVRTSLMKHFIQQTRIDVLHNSIDLSAFTAPLNGISIRKECRIPDDAFLYTFIGRLIHQKAIDVLIEAFKDVSEESCLLIVGQGKYRDTIERQVKKYNLEKKIVFTGVRSDVPRLLSSADCFVLPSRYEGLPLVLIEALAAGSAIIVSDFESAQEVIVHEKNGLVVPKEDAKALSQAMLRMKDDDALRSRLAVASRKSSEKFSISRHVDALLQYAVSHNNER